MGFDASQYVIGDEWAYRLRDTATSERVRIKAVTPKKVTASIEVEFLDDAGHRLQTVPSTRLKTRWADVQAYDARQADWQRIDDFELDSVEQRAVNTVYSALIPDEVAGLDWRPVENATIIKDRAKLTDILQLPVEEIFAKVQWFTTDDTTIVSPAGTVIIAEAACRAHSHTILEHVIEEETEARHKCKHGGPHPFRKDEDSSPEWEYRWYCEYVRPEHELLRQWCGHRAVAAHERLTAAEAENHRLDLLVVQLVKALDLAGETMEAERFAEEHERDRVTPYTARPVVDRPLHWSEMPVREVQVNRRRWGVGDHLCHRGRGPRAQRHAPPRRRRRSRAEQMTRLGPERRPMSSIRWSARPRCPVSASTRNRILVEGLGTAVASSRTCSPVVGRVVSPPR